MSTSRNAPCPCGSGKKYKQCCLHTDQHAANPDASTTSLARSTVTREDICIADEVEHIRSCALAGTSHFVTLGPLLFFSTVTGDAWLLDPEDHLAACLMTEGQSLPVAITETATNFQIPWQGRYTLGDQSFIVTDAEGQTITYPCLLYTSPSPRDS